MTQIESAGDHSRLGVLMQWSISVVCLEGGHGVALSIQRIL